MKSRAHVNYWIFVVIGIAFVLSTLSGLVLYLGPAGGYQGGRNAGYGQTVLLLGHHTWSELHTWSSIAMAVGVLGHLILHWKWIARMTRKLFRVRKKHDEIVIAYPTTKGGIS